MHARTHARTNAVVLDEPDEADELPALSPVQKEAIGPAALPVLQPSHFHQPVHRVCRHQVRRPLPCSKPEQPD